ncbi:uncharacterized protein LOC142741762 [Rhinoderma darwinii]|uniref:uncharacterized protein LOC142741762 n=1 Tax=Rhinoderma darwinii TaxID=43563 RepID=UPI003F670C2A
MSISGLDVPVSTNVTTVINLSDLTLTPDCLSLLSKGFNYCINSEFDYTKFEIDLYKSIRKMNLHRVFSGNISTKMPPIGERKVTVGTLGFSLNDNFSAEDRKMLHILMDVPIEEVDYEPQLYNIETFQGGKPSTFNPPLPAGSQLDLFQKEVLRDVKCLIYPSATPNLSVDERKALKWLSSNKNVILKPADKGGNIVLLSKEYYIQEAHRQLDDKMVYEILKQEPTSLYLRLLRSLLRKGVEGGFFSESFGEKLIIPFPNRPYWYFIPKADEMSQKLEARGYPVQLVKEALNRAIERMPYTLADHALLDWLIYRRFGQQAMLDEEPLRKRRRYWVHPIVSQRPRKGHFHTLYDDLRQHPEKFHNFCRMSISSFDCLLSDLGPGITLQDTNMRQCISPKERLIVTLRFPATGNSFASLHFEFLLGCSTISQIIRLTCEVIWQRLRAAVMPQPKAEDWLRIAEGFYQSAQFPNCVGALDGKHIRVKKPPHSGSLYFNYKQYFSVVLLALADSDYRFVIVDIGAYGSSLDAGIFRASNMGERLQSNQLALPEPRQLPGSTGPPAPFVIVADEGFGLSPHVLRPFPRRGLDERRHVFNYRLTRARRYVECAFGILSSKWRVFQSPLQMDPQNVMLVIQASVILHNFCRLHESMQDIDLEQFPTTSTIPVDYSTHGRPGTAGMLTRNFYADYFVFSAGAVPWQMDAIHGSR